MVVVVARVRVRAGRHEEFIRAAREVARPTREEPGCHVYRIHQDIEDPDAFVFVEEWSAQADLDRHFETPHVKRFVAALPDLLSAPAELKIHEVARTTVGD